jgi:hypothetical protein
MDNINVKINCSELTNVVDNFINTLAKLPSYVLINDMGVVIDMEDIYADIMREYFRSLKRQ